MSNSNSPSRRQRVEPGIYTRTDAQGRTVFEIGFRDVQGRQRWRRVEDNVISGKVRPAGLKDARAALAEAHAARSRGERVAADPRLTFERAADEWWKARAVRLRPATQSAYAASLGLRKDDPPKSRNPHTRPESLTLLGRFGRTRLADIQPRDVAAFITARQDAGAKGWTVKGDLTVLGAVFKHASRHLGFTGASPVTLLDRIERPSIEDERPKRVLTPDELRRLLVAVDESYRLIFELAAETGARLGETLGLVWGEVDLDAQTVTFTHQLDRRGKRVPLKTTRSRRCVEITPGLVAKLRAAKVAADASGDHDFVFVSRTGTPHDHRNVAGRVLSRAVKRAGLGAVKRDGQIVEYAPSFHSLRHSHGSALIAAGFDIEEVSARLGHANIATTQRIYVHAYDAARRSDQRRNRLAAMYAGSNADVPAVASVKVMPVKS